MSRRATGPEGAANLSPAHNASLRQSRNLVLPWKSGPSWPRQSRGIFMGFSPGGRFGFACLHGVALAILLFSSALLAQSSPAIRFEDATAKSGIQFTHNFGAQDLGSLLESTGGGCVWFDYNNDGLPDLYVVSGKPLGEGMHPYPLRTPLATPPHNHLYKNNGDGTFTDVTDKAGVTANIYGMAAIAADFDNDGYTDLFVTGYGRTILYHNNGDGTFTNVAPRLGVDDRGWTLDVGACDLFNTGHLDLYLANDFGQDVIYKNNGDGTFTNVTAHALPIDTRKGMNVDFADLDGDGYPDIYVSNITKPGYLVEGNFLWHNNRDGTFTDYAPTLGVDNGGWSWGAKFVDLDNDGEMEIVVLNGFVSAGPGDYWFQLGTMATTPGLIVDDARNWPPIGNDSISGYERSRLFVKRGTSYIEIATEAGITDLYDGRGLCIADYDNNGLPELFVANQGAPFLLYKNQPQQRNHWIGLRLIGTGRSNRDAIGARVTLTVGGRRRVKWVDPGSGFASQSDRRLIFGLGALQKVDGIEVRWPDGRVEYAHPLEIDRYHTLTEGDLAV